MDRRELEAEVERLLDTGALTKWEYSFLTSIGDKLSRGWTLSQAEQEKLDEIIEAKG